MLNQNPVCACDRISFVYCEKPVFKGEKQKMKNLTKPTLQSWQQRGPKPPAITHLYFLKVLPALKP